MDSNPNAPENTDRKLELLSVVGRVFFSIFLAIGLVLFLGATAWSRYSDQEIASVMTSEEKQIQALRDQEINQLRITLGRRLPGNRRADLYFRLAEIYIEAYRTAFLIEGRAHQERLSQGKADKTIDRTHSRPYLKRGIQACQDILKLGVAYPKMDHVYYFLAFYHGELEEKASSLKYYHQLIKRYPESPFVIEAYRELGDSAFEKNQFRTARSYYEKAVKADSESETAPRVMHKLAWAYYRTKNYAEAIQTMKAAISKAQKSGERYVSLREEALRDMAVFMTEAGQVSEAIAYFKSVAGDSDYYPKMLEQLGKQFERTADPARAILVYESLLKTHPKTEAAFRVQAKLVDLHLRQKQYGNALKRLQKFRVYSNGDAETQVTLQNLRAMVRRTATEKHEGYRKAKGNRKDRGDLLIAEGFYSVYLEKFLSESDPRSEAPEIKMYLAEVKRELGKSGEASTLYSSVVKTQDPRYAKEAGALWTATLSEEIKKETSRTSKKVEESASEPSGLESQFVEAADHLSDSLKGTLEAREAALKAAQVLAAYSSRQKEAVSRSETLVREYPGSAQAVIAARLWIQILADRFPKDSVDPEGSDLVEDLEKTIKLLRSNEKLMMADQGAGSKLSELLAAQDRFLKVNAIAYYEKSGAFQKAARGYEEFASRTRDRAEFEKALENASAAYAKAGDLDSVLRVSQMWLDRTPQSQKAATALKFAATVALIQGRYEQSAAVFERVGLHAREESALLTAAKIFSGTGNHERSRKIWLEYLKFFPKGGERSQIQLQLARSYDSEGNSAQASEFLKSCMNSAPAIAIECSARLGDLYQEHKDFENAKKAYQSAVRTRNPGSPYLGYSYYQLAVMMEHEAEFAELALPDKQLKKALNQRLGFLEPLSKAYNSAVNAGGPWSVAALGRLAAWAFRFADEVEGIRAPASVTPSALEEFKRSLASVSAPLRQKAFQSWAQANEVGSGSAVLSPALPAIADRLSDLAKEKYPRAQGPKVNLRLAGISATGGELGLKKALKQTREQLQSSPKSAELWVDYGNLLWGENKPLLARLAYEQALNLDRKSAAAMNNQGVVLASLATEEEWSETNQAMGHFENALEIDPLFLPAKANQAFLYNYYRVFPKARKLWDQVLVKSTHSDFYDGSGVAFQGMGKLAEAEKEFERADALGGSSRRFAKLYHLAARESLKGSNGAEECIDELEDIRVKELAGFELLAHRNLMEACRKWKEEK